MDHSDALNLLTALQERRPTREQMATKRAGGFMKLG
jgi:hypothetical protein